MLGWLKKSRVGQFLEYLKNIVLKWKLNYKEEIKMVDMYVALVMNKRRQIPSGGPLPMVPVQYSAAVLADLNALGLDGYGKLLPVESGEPTE